MSIENFHQSLYHSYIYILVFCLIFGLNISFPVWTFKSFFVKKILIIVCGELLTGRKENRITSHIK